MNVAKSYRIFISADQKSMTPKVDAFLSDFEDYEVHFIPTVFTLFDMVNMGADIIVLDSEAKNVVDCRQW